MRRSPGAAPDAEPDEPPLTFAEGALGSARAPAIAALILLPALSLGMDRGHGARYVRPDDRRQRLDDDVSLGHGPSAAALGDVGGEMAGMMLPSAAPLVLLFGAARRREPVDAAPRIYALVAGYLASWALFSLAATALQRAAARLLIVSPMMEATTAAASHRWASS